MREEFYDIYEELSRMYEGLHSSPIRSRFYYALRRHLGRGPRWVRKEVEWSISELELELAGTQLRPDARHFLLINFTEMVVFPVLALRNSLPVNPEQLRQAICADVRTLVSAAREQHRGEEISSGDVLRATAESWDGLQINNLQFWGARENAERG